MERKVFAGVSVGMSAMFIGVGISDVMYRPADPQSLQEVANSRKNWIFARSVDTIG
jgi:hypothetical protein